MAKQTVSRDGTAMTVTASAAIAPTVVLAVALLLGLVPGLGPDLLGLWFWGIAAAVVVGIPLALAAVVLRILWDRRTSGGVPRTPRERRDANLAVAFAVVALLAPVAAGGFGRFL